MDTHDRYVLAAAMLAGEREAELELADFLEEIGETELAEWMRCHSKPGQRQVQVAIMLLPWRVAISLGVDFAEMAYDVLDWRIFRQWLAGEVSDQAMANFLRGPLSKGLEAYWKATAGNRTPAETARLREQAIRRVGFVNIVINALRQAIKHIVLPDEDRSPAEAEQEARRQIRYLVIRTWHLTRQGVDMEEWQRLKTLEALQNLIVSPAG